VFESIPEVSLQNTAKTDTKTQQSKRLSSTGGFDSLLRSFSLSFFRWLLAAVIQQNAVLPRQ
jgi:hypothetical protein